MIDWTFHAGCGALTIAYRRAAIFGAIGNNRPTIILSGLGNIYFIAPARPMLIGPEPSRFRVKRRALLVAMAVRPDLRQRAFLSRKRVVFRHRAIRPDADDLAEMGVEVL